MIGFLQHLLVDLAVAQGQLILGLVFGLPEDHVPGFGRGEPSQGLELLELFFLQHLHFFFGSVQLLLPVAQVALFLF